MERTIGQKLRKLRKDADLTQEDIAVHLSVLGKTISRYENDRTRPSFNMLHELAKYFRVPVSYLVDDDLKYRKTKVQQLLDELIKEGLITDANNISESMQGAILNAVKVDLALQLNKQEKEQD